MSLSWAEGGIVQGPVLTCPASAAEYPQGVRARPCGLDRPGQRFRKGQPSLRKESLPVSVLGWCSARIGQGDCGHSERGYLLPAGLLKSSSAPAWPGAPMPGPSRGRRGPYTCSRAPPQARSGPQLLITLWCGFSTTLG